MRASIAVAASIAGLFAGAAAARAADLPLRRSGGDACCYSGHVMPLVIWDNQPGVVMRAWWLPPWRNRHYFPAGRKIAVSHASDDSGPPAQAESYERSWSAGPRPRRRPRYLLPPPELARP